MIFMNDVPLITSGTSAKNLRTVDQIQSDIKKLKKILKISPEKIEKSHFGQFLKKINQITNDIKLFLEGFNSSRKERLEPCIQDIKALGTNVDSNKKKFDLLNDIFGSKDEDIINAKNWTLKTSKNFNKLQKELIYKKNQIINLKGRGDLDKSQLEGDLDPDISQDYDKSLTQKDYDKSLTQKDIKRLVKDVRQVCLKIKKKNNLIDDFINKKIENHIEKLSISRQNLLITNLKKVDNLTDKLTILKLEKYINEEIESEMKDTESKIESFTCKSSCSQLKDDFKKEYDINKNTIINTIINTISGQAIESECKFLINLVKNNEGDNSQNGEISGLSETIKKSVKESCDELKIQYCDEAKMLDLMKIPVEEKTNQVCKEFDSKLKEIKLPDLIKKELDTKFKSKIEIGSASLLENLSSVSEEILKINELGYESYLVPILEEINKEQMDILRKKHEDQVSSILQLIDNKEQKESIGIALENDYVVKTKGLISNKLISYDENIGLLNKINLKNESTNFDSYINFLPLAIKDEVINKKQQNKNTEQLVTLQKQLLNFNQTLPPSLKEGFSAEINVLNSQISKLTDKNIDPKNAQSVLTSIKSIEIEINTIQKPDKLKEIVKKIFQEYSDTKSNEYQSRIDLHKQFLENKNTFFSSIKSSKVVMKDLAKSEDELLKNSEKILEDMENEFNSISSPDELEKLLNDYKGRIEDGYNNSMIHYKKAAKVAISDSFNKNFDDLINSMKERYLVETISASKREKVEKIIKDIEIQKNNTIVDLTTLFDKKFETETVGVYQKINTKHRNLLSKKTESYRSKIITKIEIILKEEEDLIKEEEDLTNVIANKLKSFF
jgi:hypothetical protein